MKENKDQAKPVSTCFEGAPAAELMEKILGKGGIGSLCGEKMRSTAAARESRAGQSQDKDQGSGGVK